MNVLAIGAHPDDIEYGCSGTLLKLRNRDHKIFLMIMTRGECGGDSKVRLKEQQAVAEVLKVEDLFWGEQVDTKLPVDNTIITMIDKTIKDSAADLVLFNHQHDIHQDHRALAHCAISATRYMKHVLTYEVPTTRVFEPDIFVDIGDVIDEKEQLLRIHTSQIEKTRVPHLTIIENARACAGFRGFQGRVKYAEGFKALRYLIEWQ